MKRASGSTCSRSPGMQKKRQSSSKPSGASLSGSATFGSPSSGRKLVNAPSAFSTASRSILPRSAARMMGIFSAGARSSLKPPSARSPARAVLRKSRVSDILVSGFSKGIPFQPFDDPVRGGTDAEGEAAPRRIGRGCGLLREQRAAPLHHADHAGAQADLLRPRGAQDEWREPVGPVRLARPEVGVAGRLGALVVLLVVRQADACERNSQSPSLSHNRDPICGKPDRVAPWTPPSSTAQRSSGWVPQSSW